MRSPILVGYQHHQRGGKVDVEARDLQRRFNYFAYIFANIPKPPEALITHKYRGSQQFSRVEYSTQIYRFDTRGAKEYFKVLAAELSIQPHLEINCLQQVISSKVI